MTTYSLRQFGHMIIDEVRMEAYAAAIAAAVQPGDVVVDAGAGTGIFSLLACQRGARHVYAVDTNPLVLQGRADAERNGFADRITHIHGDATTLDLPEPVDVVLGDLRGRLPGFDITLGIYRSLVARHLRPHGRVLPQRDVVWAAPLSDARLYDSEIRTPWERNRFGLDLSASRRQVVNSPLPFSLKPDCGLLPPQEWVTLDYASGERRNAATPLRWPVDSPIDVHFLVIWYDTELYGGFGYTNSPLAARRPQVYNQLLLPLEQPVDLEPGEALEVDLRVNMLGGEFVFTHTIRVLAPHADAPRLERRQSTFDAMPLHDLAKRAVDRVPKAGAEALLLQDALAGMDGSRSIAELADDLRRTHPALLPDRARALEYTTDLASRFGD